MNRRLRLLTNYEGRCHICGLLIEGTAFDLDHLVPTHRGGTNAVGNQAPAHSQCNRRKQDEVAHTNAGLQFSLFRKRRTRHAPQVFRSQISNYEAECQTWIEAQCAAGRRDSGLLTRFHYWLTDRLQLPFSFSETQRQFIALCQQMQLQICDDEQGFFYAQWEDSEEEDS